MGDLVFLTVQCAECGHELDSRLTRCPLCGVALPHYINGEAHAYPSYVGYAQRRRRQQLRRLVAFISVSAIIVVLAINVLYQSHGWWSLIVITVIAYSWLTVSDTVLSLKSLMLRLGVQVYALVAVMVILDWRTGWHGWSVDYVIPAVLFLSLVGALVGIGLSRFYGWKTSEIFGFAVAVTVGALIMLGLSFTPLVEVAWPSLTVACVGVVLLTASAVFLHKEFSQYLREQWHF